MTDDVAFLRAREQHATKALKELRLSMHSRIEKANADVIAERHRAEAERDRLREELMGMRAACSTKDEKISQLSRRLVRIGPPAPKRDSRRADGGSGAAADVAVACAAEAQLATLAAGGVAAATTGQDAVAASQTVRRSATSAPPPALAWSSASPPSGAPVACVGGLTAAKADLVPKLKDRWRELKQCAAKAEKTEAELEKLVIRAQDPDYRQRVHEATITDKAFNFTSPDAERDIKRAAATGSALVVARHVLEAMGRGRGAALLRLYQGEIDVLTHRGNAAAKAFNSLLVKIRQLDKIASAAGGDALEDVLSATNDDAALLRAQKEIRQLREAVLAERRHAEKTKATAGKEKQTMQEQLNDLRAELQRANNKISYLKRRGGIEVPRPALRGAAARGPESFNVATVGAAGRPDEAKTQALALVEAQGRLQQWQLRAAQAEQKASIAETSLQRHIKMLEDAQRQLRALHDATEQRETEHQQTMINLRGEVVSARMQSRRAYARAQERYRTKQSATQTVSGAQTEPCVNRMCQTVEDWPKRTMPETERGTEPEPEPEPEGEPDLTNISGVMSDAAEKLDVEMVQVAIGFETADVRGAGTSADVCIELFGAPGRGSSGTLLFKNSGVYFKRGSTSWFTVSVPALLWFGSADTDVAGNGRRRGSTNGPVRVTIGHDLPCEHSRGQTPFGSGRWLLHVVHVVCEAEPDHMPLAFWCGDEWFDSGDAGGVVRTFARTAASKLPKLRSRPPPQFRLEHADWTKHTRPAVTAQPSRGAQTVSFAPNITAKSVGGRELTRPAKDSDGTPCVPAGAEYTVVVHCRAVTPAATPLNARIGVVLHGASRTARGMGANDTTGRTSPLSETVLVCHPMGVERQQYNATQKSVAQSGTGMFAAWSGRDLISEAEMERKSHREILSEEAVDISDYIVDLIVEQAVSIAEQAQIAAASVLRTALGSALGKCTESQAMVEELMGDIVDGAERQLDRQAGTPAKMQSITMPPIIVHPSSEEQEALAAGLPCEMVGLGEAHTVQLVDLSGSVGGDGAWVYVHGVEVVDVASGKAWWFVAKAWLPPAGRGGGGLCLREQANSLGALIGGE